MRLSPVRDFSSHPCHPTRRTCARSHPSIPAPPRPHGALLTPGPAGLPAPEPSPALPADRTHGHTPGPGRGAAAAGSPVSATPAGHRAGLRPLLPGQLRTARSRPVPLPHLLPRLVQPPQPLLQLPPVAPRRLDALPSLLQEEPHLGLAGGLHGQPRRQRGGGGAGRAGLAPGRAAHPRGGAGRGGKRGGSGRRPRGTDRRGGDVKRSVTSAAGRARDDRVTSRPRRENPTDSGEGGRGCGLSREGAGAAARACPPEPRDRYGVRPLGSGRGSRGSGPRPRPSLSARRIRIWFRARFYRPPGARARQAAPSGPWRRRAPPAPEAPPGAEGSALPPPRDTREGSAPAAAGAWWAGSPWPRRPPLPSFPGTTATFR